MVFAICGDAILMNKQAGHVDDAVSRVAQRFWLEREEAVEQLKKSPFVAFYCGRSQGRGPRVAGW